MVISDSRMPAGQPEDDRQRDEALSLLERFEVAWRSGPPPRIEEFLAVSTQPASTGAANSTESSELLEELVKIDLEYRWRRPNLVDRFLPAHPKLEDYVALYPGLGSAENLTVDLIGEEYRVRRCWGDGPSHAEYVERFIGRGTELAIALAKIDAELAADAPPLDPVFTAADRCRFEILRPHARGGLGEVSVALDRDLKREVALKEISTDHAGDLNSQSRFLREAEITGRLEHPGIVPVYALGRHADGRPYYAMRFIRGQSLREAIMRLHGAEAPARGTAAWAWELRLLLRRFLDACNAMAYAHSQGILHRDLKPDNIMLGPYGETLVVDWGLAKSIGPSASVGTAPTSQPQQLLDTEPMLTRRGSVIGTPGYMSPEQASGDLERIGPAGDIYSLGATLSTLLTGRPPALYTAPQATEVTAQDVRRTVFGPKGDRPVVSRALEAVCRKAMAPKCEDRYASVSALADDVERWLADEPMIAWRAPWTTQVLRWMRKHRTPVAAAVAALVMGLVALGVGYWRVSQSNEQLRLAKAETDRRLDQTLQAVQDYYTGVSQDVLLGKEEFQGLRARLLERPQKFYEQMTRELETAKDERGQSLVARGRVELARIMHTLGRHEEARRQVESAIPTYLKLLASRPNVATYQDGLAQCHDLLGKLKISTGDVQGALQSHQQAIESSAQLLVSHPDVADYQDTLAGCYSNLGLVQTKMADLPAAAESFRQAVTIRLKLRAAHPDVPAYQHGLARCYNNLGGVEGDRGDHQKAVEAYREAIAMQSQLAASWPDVPDYQLGLGHYYFNMGLEQRMTGNLRDATESFRQCAAAFEKLVAIQPNVPDYQSGLARGYNALGSMRRVAGDFRGSIDSYQRGIVIESKLVERHPGVPDYMDILAQLQMNLGNVQRAAGDSRSAAESYRRAVEGHAKLAAALPGIPDYQHDLALSYDSLASLQHEMEDLGGSAQSYREGIALATRLVAAQPELKDYQETLGMLHANLGRVKHTSGDSQGAAESLREAINIETKLVDAHRDVPGYASMLGDAYGYLGLALLAQGRNDEAERIYRQAIERQRQSVVNWPDEVGLRTGLGVQIMGLVHVLRLQGRTTAAGETARELLTLQPKDKIQLYNAACELALCAQVEPDDSGKQTLADAAVASLRAAISAGWRDAIHTSLDSDLDALRARADFRRLLEELFDAIFPADPFQKGETTIMTHDTSRKDSTKP